MDLGTKLFGYRLPSAFSIKVFVTQVGPALVHEHLTFPFGLGHIYFASTLLPVKPLDVKYTHT